MFKNQDIPVKSLERYCIKEAGLEWFKSYLTERKQITKMTKENCEYERNLCETRFYYRFTVIIYSQ